MDWSKYPNFYEHEFKCSYSGLCDMKPEFMDLLQQIRTAFNKPMFVSSGYRHFTHPKERTKAVPGEHTHGLCCDVLISGPDVPHFLNWCYDLGVRRMGINQKGDMNQRFIHIGIGNRTLPQFPEAIWSY